MKVTNNYEINIFRLGFSETIKFKKECFKNVKYNKNASTKKSQTGLLLEGCIYKCVQVI